METEDFIPFAVEEEEEEVVESGTPPKKAKVQQQQRDKRTPVNLSLLRAKPCWLSAECARQHRYGHVIERLSREISDFCAWMMPTVEEEQARKACIRRVEEITTKLFPGSELKVFGSQETGLYLPTSDIDLVIFTTNAFIEKPPLKRLARAIDQAGIAEKGSIKTISKARVPIVKFQDHATGYPVDVSFNTETGTESAALIKKALATYPALQPLVILLKWFLEQRGLNEVFTGGLGSYSTMLLTWSFLQHHPLIMAGCIAPEQNLAVLLLDLLELYGRLFNYERVGISLLDGGRFFDKRDRGWTQANKPNLLCLEDPQSPDHDIGKSSFNWSAVRQSFEHALLVLLAALAEWESLERRRPHDAAQQSILASIVSIPDRIQRHRYFVQHTTNT